MLLRGGLRAIHELLLLLPYCAIALLVPAPVLYCLYIVASTILRTASAAHADYSLWGLDQKRILLHKSTYVTITVRNEFCKEFFCWSDRHKCCARQGFVAPRSEAE